MNETKETLEILKEKSLTKKLIRQHLKLNIMAINILLKILRLF